MRSRRAHITAALIGAGVFLGLALADTRAHAWGPPAAGPGPPPPPAAAAPAPETPPPPAAAPPDPETPPLPPPAASPAPVATPAALPSVEAPAPAPAPSPSSAPSPRIFGIQLAPGFKRLPKDPVAGVMYGNNAGSPQTSEIGFNFTFIVLPPGWPVSLTLGTSYASSSQRLGAGLDETAHTSEIGVGVRKTIAYGPVRAFGGAGLALCSLEVKDQYVGQGYMTWVGAGSGGFLEAGATWRIKEIVDVGLTVRYSNFWSDRFPVQKARYWDAGGLFGGLLVGYGP